MTDPQSKDEQAMRPCPKCGAPVHPENTGFHHCLPSSNLEVAQLLTDCACILDVVKGEWAESWSEWDQGVRDRITAYLRRFHDTAQGSLVGIEPHCIERVWCKLKSGHPGPCSAAAPESRDG